MAGNPFTSKTPFVKSFTCQNCGAAVTIQNARDSVVVICESCHSTIDLTDPNYKILATAKAKLKCEPLIPLGSRGKLKDILWEVIGFMRRSDVGSEFHWDEYLLFNPYQGYRWLTHAKGHWNFVTMIRERPQPYTGIDLNQQNSCFYHSEKYKLFYTGNARVVAVLGEFYWRVQVGDTVEMRDYICPPKMLSLEKDGNEQNWSVSEYMEPDVIVQVFKSRLHFPNPIGVAPNQPSRLAIEFGVALRNAAILYGLAIVFQIAHLSFSPATTVLQTTDNYSGHPRTTVTEPFELKNGLGDISIGMVAPVENTWLSVDGDVVNEKTGDSFPFAETVEHYRGYDGGESWQEGSVGKEEILPAVPAGTYHLEYTLSGVGPADVAPYVHVTPDMYYSLTVKRGVPIWSNFWLVMVLLLFYPLFVWLRQNAFEISRWSESDYSPYNTGA